MVAPANVVRYYVTRQVMPSGNQFISTRFRAEEGVNPCVKVSAPKRASGVYSVLVFRVYVQLVLAHMVSVSGPKDRSHHCPGEGLPSLPGGLGGGQVYRVHNLNPPVVGASEVPLRAC